jgi:hypothetical protein
MTSVIDHVEKAVIIYLAPAYFGQIMCIIPEWFHVLLVDARKLNFIISDAHTIDGTIRLVVHNQLVQPFSQIWKNNTPIIHVYQSVSLYLYLQ